jgi:hypothetical protein
MMKSGHMIQKYIGGSPTGAFAALLMNCSSSLGRTIMELGLGLHNGFGESMLPHPATWRSCGKCEILRA